MFLLFKVFVLKYPITEMIRLKIFLKFSGLFSCLVVNVHLPLKLKFLYPSLKCSHIITPKKHFVKHNFQLFSKI
jgi:hypothetical protein